MSFPYPRVVSFKRPGAQSGVGQVAYGGASAATETLIAEGVPCSIQGRREGVQNPVGLPNDALRPSWYVFIPKAALDIGELADRDLMIDERGNRYQVVQPYWDSMGYRLTVISLEA